MDKYIGAQYYTVREHTQTLADFDLTCKRISEIGYSVVQISGTPLAARDMRPILDTYGLKAVTSHKGLDDFKNNLDEIIEYNKILGSDLCGLGYLPTEFVASNEKMTEFIREVCKICEVLKKENMFFGYHNHAREFGKLDGKLIYDRLIEETDPETFNFILDTYWVQVGGKTPQDLIRRLGKRTMAVHFKDLVSSSEVLEEPRMCEVGSGNLDWDAIIAACEAAGTRWALVELDNNHVDGDPFKSLAVSYEYLKTKGFC